MCSWQCILFIYNKHRRGVYTLLCTVVHCDVAKSTCGGYGSLSALQMHRLN
jgi:hypothetical protein